jgi:hypothetical protein
MIGGRAASIPFAPGRKGSLYHIALGSTSRTSRRLRKSREGAIESCPGSPQRSSNSRAPSPDANSVLACPTWAAVSSCFLPTFTPRRFAAASPALVRSAIRAFSNSANAPRLTSLALS